MRINGGPSPNLSPAGGEEFLFWEAPHPPFDVPTAGVEPARPYGQRILSPLRLPITPRGQRIRAHANHIWGTEVYFAFSLCKSSRIIGTGIGNSVLGAARMPSRFTQRLLWVLLSLSLIVIAGFAISKWRHEHARHVEDFGQLPDFYLVDENGRTASLENFKGHIWVADLIFTHCSSICPLLTSKMLALQAELKDRPKIFFASISVDPQHDTPDTLRAYAIAHHANTERWTFLTGTTSAIYTLVKDGFHLPLDSVGGEQRIPIVHSPRFTLVDGNGHIRGYYDGSEDSSRTQIIADIDALENEAHP